MSDNPEALRDETALLNAYTAQTGRRVSRRFVALPDGSSKPERDLVVEAMRAALAQQAATPTGDDQALQRVGRWLDGLPEKPCDHPYWTNGMFANDCRDAAEVARQAATPAPAGWKLVPVDITPEMAKAACWRYTAEMAKDWKAAVNAAPPATPAAQPADEREAFEARFPDAGAHWDGQRYLSTIYARAWDAWQARAALAARGAA